MPFDPTKPVEDSPLDAAEMRDQLNALKALIDALQIQVNAVQSSLNAKASAVSGIPTNDLIISDPPGNDEMNTLYDKVKAIINGMKG